MFENFTKECIDWIKDWFSDKSENSKAIVGISGGVDSSTVAALCVEALGKDRVIGIKLPCGIQKDIDYSDELIKHLGIKSYEVNIGNAFDAITQEMRKVAENGKEFPNDCYSTNTPARLRMTALFGAAALIGNAYVANTCNLSETMVGYDTFGGDNLGVFAPIAKFTKTEVRATAKNLGLPEKLYNKVPIDGMSLNEDGSYKTDEDKLGFTYEELDDYLRNGNIGPNVKLIEEKIRFSEWKRRMINIDCFQF